MATRKKVKRERGAQVRVHPSFLKVIKEIKYKREIRTGKPITLTRITRDIAGDIKNNVPKFT